MASIIQIRRDTASNWTSANPILALGEMGAETDTSKIKIGDGTTAWASVPYLIDAGDYLTATSTNTLTNKTIAYADNTLTGVVPTSDIGVSVQAYDADTTKNDVANTFTAAQTFGASVVEKKVAMGCSRHRPVAGQLLHLHAVRRSNTDVKQRGLYRLCERICA
jgi:hypothetical protein